MRTISPSNAWLAIAAAIVIFCGAAYTYFNFYYPGNSDDKVAVATKVDPTKGWKTYTNTDVGFTLKYPENWKVLKLNQLTSNVTADGQYGGKSLSSSDGKNGEVYFDSDNQITLRSYATTYNSYGPPEFNKQKVDVNWTAEQFATNMGLAKDRILLTKKLSEKSILIVDSVNMECSPSLRILVLTPLTTEYPNLEVSISAVDDSKDADVRAYLKKVESDKSLDICDRSEPYGAIAKKIDAGTYSENLNSQIQTAQLIADSLKIDETLSWQTYTNSAYGYSVKYPKDWSPTSIGDIRTESGVSISNKNVNYGLGLEATSSQLSLDNYIAGLKNEAKKLIDNGQPVDTFGSQSNITVDGQLAVKVTNCTQGASAYKYDWYFIKKNDYIYKISITKVVGEGPVFDAAPYISVAERMMMTFKLNAI